jgi:hypothetical protein
MLLVALVLAGCVAEGALAASRYLPHLRFRVITTPHFRIYYHQGGEAAARAVAVIAEQVHGELPARLRLRAPSVTHVVVADQDDVANGSAVPLPYNTVTLSVSWPAAQDLIGYTRDWLRLVFTHEYAHILHLDQSVGWAAGVRKVLGRSPLAYPNLALPNWEIEGFATYLESRETGEGRLRAGDATTLVTDRVRRVGPEPLDRYNGGLVDWPGGTGPYLYGGLFHEYLAARFGEEKLGELARRSAGRLHFFSAGAFRPVFGVDLPSLWRDFQRELVTRTPGPEPGTQPARLTHHGFAVGLPRFSADGAFLLYSLQTPHGFPSLQLMAAAAGARPVQLATRFGGEGLSVSRAYAFFDQLEVEGNVALRSDLFAARLPDGRARQLTRGARLLDPAASPDGTRLVAIHAEGGRRDLVWFRVESDGDGPRLVPAPPPAGAREPGGRRAEDVKRADGADQPRCGAPRWSPDGRWLAVERRLPLGPSQIVAIDASSGRQLVLASSDVGRSLTPAWTADGQRVLFASDREGSFQVYSVPLAGGDVVRLTSAAGGAQAPEVSPDGRRLVYVGYTEAGYDLFEMPLPDVAAGGPPIVPRSDPAPVLRPYDDATLLTLPDRSYSPWNTLLPRSWAPAADTRNEAVRIGATTGGVDVLGRHAWSATALWRIGGEGDAPDSRHRALPDWAVGYIYDRWRTALFASVSDETSSIPRYAPDGRRLDDAALQERHASFGAAVPWMKVRHRQLLEASFDYDRLAITAAEGERRTSRNSIRAAWLLSSAKAYGYSIGPEEGGAVSLTTEQVREGLGADGNAQAWIAQGRWYQRAGGRHTVLALRGGVAASAGDQEVRRIFYLGGSDPSPLVDYGSEAVAMLRGVEPLAYSGRRVAGATVEYRVPIVRVERGWRTFPVFLRTLHGAVFADAGHAWNGDFAWGDIKSSLGVEFSADVVAGFGLPLTVAAGVAWARDGATGQRLDPAGYVRLGRSF